MVLESEQRVAGVLRDVHAKNDVAYILTSRSRDWIVLSQSLPLLAAWVNEKLACDEQWDKVSVTGLFESLNRTGGRNGGWHKGRFRVRSVPLADSGDAFEVARGEYANAAIVQGMPFRYLTVRG